MYVHVTVYLSDFSPWSGVKQGATLVLGIRRLQHAISLNYSKASNKYSYRPKRHKMPTKLESSFYPFFVT